ncbi:NAD(P)/FAD-dependent oxidoreductase [Marinobacter sp. AL4B]|uniref:NAD(P)/FAD-dependent oxidoreductase n=1 Tax=Marinobacter sp. AL4B TaxID=2871173 RepID=UPI001CAA6C9A|nr:FAD-dependent oxidoreductase [Marinobacter sp. AL4B]MBZ0333528.1 FAD-dependent oxidoreductase [Marinobacter sp. AL4B]
MESETLDTSSIRKIAIIGSGLAGLTAAIMLGRSGHQVRVFEKSRGPGGRLASKRVANGAVDVGAQYFTSRNPAFLKFLEDYAGADRFGPWRGTFGFQKAQEGWQPFPGESRYVGIPRMTAITRGLSEHVELTAQVRIERITRTGARWQLVSTDGKELGEFDQVVITAPPAQTQELLAASGMTQLLSETHAPGGDILPCWAVAVHFLKAPSAPFDAMRPDSDVLYWVANNSSKPGRDDSGQWWVLHATPEWTKANVDTTPETVTNELLTAFRGLTGFSGVPVESVAHRWLYARSASTDQPGFLWDQGQGVGVAGDWLVGGRVEGAWESANRLAEAMQAGE